MTKKRYAFWPEQKHQFSSQLCVYPWNFYWLADDEIDWSLVPYEEVPEDTSQVGSTLKRMFRWFGYKSQHCNCEWIRQMLDDASLEFIEKHADKIVDLICKSARQQKTHANPILVRKLLALSVLRNRVKLVTLF